MKTAVLEQELSMLRTSEGVFLKNTDEAQSGGSLGWLSAEIYEKTISWMYQCMTSLKSHEITKSLSRLYLISYLSDNRGLQPDQIVLAAVSAIRLSFKFNESMDFPINMALRLVSNRYTTEDFARVQNGFLMSLGFKLKLTTPHCFLQTVANLLPIKDSSIYEHLSYVLQYSQLLKDFSEFPSGSLFFGSLLYLTRKRQPQLVSRILQALGSSWPHVDHVVNMLQQRLEEDLSDSMEVETADDQPNGTHSDPHPLK